MLRSLEWRLFTHLETAKSSRFRSKIALRGRFVG